ncbi:MAG: hypothetical protein DBX38_07455 [Eubacteriales Family XIII. Incertae Sedis bacterium]|nr:MAG: hypothetical protein DBX38_07455 [Clostridiales Family XIII bacterium]
MNRKFIIFFEKSGYIKYISHLDMMRLFNRVIRKCSIKLAYSQGFNPHPKMSFALPLALGYTGKNEILEIETAEDYKTAFILSSLNRAMPDGISIKDVQEDRGERGNKTIASAVYAGEYIAEIPLVDDASAKLGNITKKTAAFLSQPIIVAEKLQRKTGKILEIDIKPLIDTLTAVIIDNKFIMTTIVAQGSTATLSPELLLTVFCKFIGLDFERSEVEMTRTQILYH